MTIHTLPLVFGSPEAPRPPSAADLRDYQAAFVQRLRGELAEGYRRVLGVAPTGSGKTVVAAHIIGSAVAKKSGIAFLAHRKELIDQTSAKLDGLGIDHGVVMADHPRHRPWLKVQVASVQTLVRRELPYEPDLVFIDEAHHARAGTYETLLARWPKAALIGLTATPWRADNRGLGELFQRSVVAATPRELQEQGYLCPCVGFAYEHPDLSGVKVTAGDYNEAESGQAMSKVQILGNMVEMWQAHAAGTRTVVFAVHIEHSKRVLEEFREARHHGAPICQVEHLDGTTPKELREEVLARIDSGETQVLTNVGVLTEGWDCPRVETLLLARPTKSTSLFLQMTGRAARPVCRACGQATSSVGEACHLCASVDVKRTYRLHDHAGAVLEHGLPDGERDYELLSDLRQRRKKGDEAACPIRTCSKCFAVFDPELDACPQCGEIVIRAGRKVVDVEAKPMSLEEAAVKHAVSSEHKRRVFEQLAASGTARGYKPGWASNVFRAKFGHWPLPEWVR